MGGQLRMKRLAGRALVLLACLTAVPATAQADESNAEATFQLGLAAMKKKDYVTACEAFAESNKADPSPGTQINLALCFENRKLWASAYTWYRSALGLAQQRGQHEREQLAESSANRIEGQVHHVVVATKEPLVGLVVKRDEVEVTTMLNGHEVPVPVDPGEHKFVVTAKGKKPWATSLSVADNNKTDRIDVPPLEAEVVAPPPPSVGTVGEYRPPIVQHDGSSQRTAGVIVAGTGALSGLAAVGMFIYAGKTADKRDTYNAQAAQTMDAKNKVEILKSAKDYASATDNNRLIAWILTAGAGVLVGTGVVLYLTAPKAPKVGATRILPLLAPGLAGLGATGSF